MSSRAKTIQAVEGIPRGGCKAISFKSLIVLAFFWASVKTFLFDVFFGFVFGLAFAFAGFRFGLAVDFAEGMALGVVFFAAGFFAAFVFEVVGAFRAAAVVRPVCALGRDTGLVAYARHDVDDGGEVRRAILSRLCNWELLWSAATR